MPELTQITDLDITDAALVDHLAAITFQAFKENAPDWIPTMALAKAQVLAAGSTGRLGRVLSQDNNPMGWIGLIKGARVWEIHPIAVSTDQQYQGLGHLLVEDVAAIAKTAGALTLYASTSDEVGTTNLFGIDLYADPAGAIRTIEATGRNPYKFWEKAGFTLVGLLPDAEGLGKPALQLARRL